VQGTGALSLSNFETIPAEEAAWGWLLPDDTDELRFAPNARCDLMLVDASSDEFRDRGFVFGDVDPHVLLFRRQRDEQ
jgi:hypothetical protein